MRSNRSIPTATVIPVLSYPSVRDAVAWLGAAFGFIEQVRILKATARCCPLATEL